MGPPVSLTGARSPRDQFEVGSNTETFTAALILQLVDQGKVKLDAPVETYLPGVVPNGAHITVRMLLNHMGRVNAALVGDELTGPRSPRRSVRVPGSRPGTRPSR